jgi:hypothetical protein
MLCNSPPKTAASLSGCRESYVKRESESKIDNLVASLIQNTRCCVN